MSGKFALSPENPSCNLSFRLSFLSRLKVLFGGRVFIRFDQLSDGSMNITPDVRW